MRSNMNETCQPESETISNIFHKYTRGANRSHEMLHRLILDRYAPTAMVAWSQDHLGLNKWSRL